MQSGLSQLVYGVLLPCLCLFAGAEAPPLITRQPVALSISVGAAATFNVSASAAPTPAYQWQRNAKDIPGATNRTFQVLNAQLADAGSYHVIVSNKLGSAKSEVAELDVDPTFTEIGLPLLTIPGGSSGASWSDINNDGALDLLIVAKAQGGTILLTNRGDGSFAKALNSGVPVSGLGGGPFGDIDNDGNVDLFISGANRFYRNKGAGKFVALTGTQAVTGAYTAAWADYDNDGFIDLFCGNYYTGGANFLLRNNGQGGFTKVVDLAPARDRSYSQGIAWGDYDNDGRADLLVSNTSGQKCFLYHNDGASGFTKITNSPVTTVAGNYACGAWGDYDNDGYLDLFLCGYKERRRLFHNDRAGSFSQALSAGFTAADVGEDQSASWVDFDNDGHLDLFICGGGLVYGLKDALYRNNGNGTFSRHLRGSPVNDQGEGAAAAWGDFDRNGFPDLFITNFQNTGARSNYLYRNSGNGSAWLNVRLTGRVSNRSAIGTKIRVTASIGGKPIQQLREISGGGAYLAQNALEAMFGLGDATIIDSVSIEWPSGIVQQLQSVGVRQFLSVAEPPRISDANFSAGEFSFRCQGVDAGTVLESSVDLDQWVRLTNGPLRDGIYTQAASTNRRQFFRTMDLSTNANPAPAVLSTTPLGNRNLR